jgi:hypothetical protein
LINGITAVDSFGFQVDYTDLDRKLFIGNNVYMYQDWMLDWYVSCPWAKDKIKQRLKVEIYNPSPMLGQDEIDFIDSVDENGKKVFKTLNVDWSTILLRIQNFVVPATNLDTIKLFIEAKWGPNSDLIGHINRKPDLTSNGLYRKIYLIQTQLILQQQWAVSLWAI